MNPQKGEIVKVVESDDPSLTNTFWKVMGGETRTPPAAAAARLTRPLDTHTDGATPMPTKTDRNPACIYVEPVQGIAPGKGKRVFLVDWFCSSRGTWRGQVFHTGRDVPAEMASSLGRTVVGSMGPQGS